MNEIILERITDYGGLIIKIPRGEHIEGHLTMITAVLKVLLSEEEFKQLTEFNDGE